MDEVRLPDLEVIRRFSIAVKRERAPVDEVVAALQADLDAIMRAQGGGAARGAARAKAAPKPRRATRR